jgi:Undecaprenyl-phosphate glucose phosphotransferase
MSDNLPANAGRSRLIELICFSLTLALVVHIVLRSLNAYDFSVILNPWRSSALAIIAWTVSTAPLFFWAIKSGPSSIFWQPHVLYWLGGSAIIALLRLVHSFCCVTLLGAQRFRHNVVIVGSGTQAERCLQSLHADRSGAAIIGVIAPGGLRHDDESIRNLAEIQRLIRTRRVSDVIVATSEHDRHHLPDLVRRLLCLPVRVLLWPQSAGVEAEWIATSGCTIGGTPLLVTSMPPLDGWQWVVKDVQDRMLACLLLIIFLPVMLAITILIRLASPGPVLFRQEREGYNGGRFMILKFRTMRVVQQKPERLQLTMKHDPRVFPLGAVLRRTSLDELPQLLNVIRGDMWLIGPRPHSPLATAAGQLYIAAVEQYMGRLKVKPGMTGLAQVKGWRGTTNTIEEIRQRVACDLYYIEHWSSWLDMQILVQTACTGFGNRNAY